jgi:putative membrane protein
VPTSPDGPGEAPRHPDYRYILANERTLLAWLRTGLALVAGGVAVATYAPDLGVSWGSGAVALGLVFLGLGTALAGYFRWRDNEEAIRDDRALPEGRMPAVLATAVAVVVVVVAVLVMVEVLSR